MKLKGRNKVSPEFSMSSMTDIVFLLLIFFMLTANTPNALDLLLPKARGKSTNTQNVSVTINKDLEYFINNEQINKEIYSAYLYMSMSAYTNDLVLKGFSNWFMVQYHEEMFHAMKMYFNSFRMQGFDLIENINNATVIGWVWHIKGDDM